MNQTPNYQLNQWDAKDRVLRTDFNADNAKIDGALTALAAADTAEAQARKALAADVLKRGNCQVMYQSYTGTGQYGADNAVTLTFPGKPMLVILATYSTQVIACRDSGARHVQITNNYRQTVNTSWTDNSISIYSKVSSAVMMNESRTIYSVIAFLAMD